MFGEPSGVGVPPAVNLENLSLEEAGFDARYRRLSRLGRGGMGEVTLYRDERIGREVALKSLRAELAGDGTELARFAREGRVQGQLEHPAIPPVYDLALRPDGVPCFTMKRLRGRTLRQILKGLAAEDPGLTRAFTLRRLLTEFANVCLAIDFAHARGVLHRDLKPGNIMLGDFGEVYVLDWGVAKITGAPGGGASGGETEEPILDTPAGDALETQAGMTLGTLGYMAPEQLRGEELDPRADIYALGAVLFEILTLKRLHPFQSPEQLAMSTLDGADARAAHRAPERDVPPELEQICLRATARRREERFATVRELHDALTRYLDGDRDLERRREIAAEHARRATESSSRALRGGDDEERARAIREASRALVLDPACEEASRVLVGLVLQPPKETPREVKEAVEASVIEASRYNARLGAWCYLLVLLYVPVVMWMGSKNIVADSLIGGGIALLSAVAFFYARSPNPPRLFLVGSLVLNAVVIAWFSRVLGPLLMVPGVACATTVIYCFHLRFRGWVPLCVLLGCLAVLVPLGLEALGLVAPSYSFQEGALVVLPTHIPHAAAPTLIFLVAVALGIVITPAIAVARIRRSLFEAEQRLHLQAWQLRQLAPDTARDLTGQ